MTSRRLCLLRIACQKPPLQSITTTAFQPRGSARITASTIREPYPLTVDVIL